MAKHKLMDLDKATWEKLKKSHDMKKKGLLSAIFTKVTGINVGDHINTFRKAAEITNSAPDWENATKLAEAAEKLEKALREYAQKKEFKTDSADDFKNAVLEWADEAKDFAKKTREQMKNNETTLRERRKEHVNECFKDLM